jgi:hypothetical protein
LPRNDCSSYRLSCGSGRTMGHRRSKAVACRISRSLSSLGPPPVPVCACAKIIRQRLSSTACEACQRHTATAVSGHLYQPAPRLYSLWHNGSPTKRAWLTKPRVFKGDAMQNGSITRSTRSHGPDVWEFRWREGGADRKRKHRRMVIGSIAQFSDKSSVRLEVAALRRQS